MLRNIKINSLLFLLLAVFACSDDDVQPLFEQDSDTRVNILLESYRETLINSEFGWKTVYQPGTNFGGNNIYLKFNEDKTVDIVSDVLGGQNDLETTFRVGISQFPELVFENYTTFHALFEAQNFNLGAEFEFIFEEVSEDRIKFRSKTDISNPTEIIFEKATAEDQENIENLRAFYDQLQDDTNTLRFIRNLVVLDDANNILYNRTFTYVDDLERTAGVTDFNSETGEISTEILPISITTTGFNFLAPLILGDLSISSFIYDQDLGTYTSTDSGVTTIIGYDLAPVATAIIPELASPDVNSFGVDFSTYSYFDESFGSSFLSQTSENFKNLAKASDVFRIDMVLDDPNFSNQSYFIFNMNDGSLNFATFTREVIANERVVFTFSQFFGDTDGLINIFALLFSTDGFYMTQTDESRFASNPSYKFTSVIAPNLNFSVYGL
ncbi:DUF4302 domain-containing protein [uncultured Aquimarina sp.]|uniref:DUF4302 domain-containing protein n=1 Tax=uncultured Aquimarina sp. TaxID=575652 RepID=UPI0026085F8D|nr:DUF4302 domain-containing protein [uncultured Aquimarina sp.]